MRRLLESCGKRFSGEDSFAALLVEEAKARGLTLEICAIAGESKRLFVQQQRRAGVEVDLARLTSDRADAVFMPGAEPQAFGEMTGAEKDERSHRRRAWEALHTKLAS